MNIFHCSRSLEAGDQRKRSEDRRQPHVLETAAEGAADYQRRHFGYLTFWRSSKLPSSPS